MLVRIAVIGVLVSFPITLICWLLLLWHRQPGVRIWQAATRGWEAPNLYTAAGQRYRRAVMVASGVAMASAALLTVQLVVSFWT